MKTELVRFHNGVESIDKHKEPATERNATLKAGAKRKFQSGMSVGERARRLQTKHKVLLDSAKATPRVYSVSAKLFTTIFQIGSIA